MNDTEEPLPAEEPAAEEGMQNPDAAPAEEMAIPLKQVMYPGANFQVVRNQQLGPMPVILIAHSPYETVTFPMAADQADQLAVNLISEKALIALLAALPPHIRAQVDAQSKLIIAPASALPKNRGGA